MITDGAGKELETTDGPKFTMTVTTPDPRGYLSVCQAANGVIPLISTRQHYSFNLAWLKQ